MTKKKSNSVSKELIDSLLEDIQVNEASLHLSDSEPNEYQITNEDSDLIPNVNAEYDQPLDINYQSSPISIEDLLLENKNLEAEKFSSIDVNEKTQQLSVSDNTFPRPATTAQDSFQSTNASNAFNPNEKTIAVGQYANRNSNSNQDLVRVTPGTVRSSQKAGQVFTSADASLMQSENLRIAQQRILDLEKEVDHLRQENEELSSAADIIKMRSDDLLSQVNTIQRSKSESEEYLKNEILILKGNLQYKENELSQSKLKVEELDSRLKLDLKKIRVRERELENRLELARSEKNAIVRSKDETILDLKRKMDQMQNELDNYRQKCLELNKNLDNNHEAFKKTTRALRLALANLELSDDIKATLKKAE